MCSGQSKFWLGLGFGAIVGAVAYRLSQTDKAQELEEDIMVALKKLQKKTGRTIDEIKDKAYELSERAKIKAERLKDKGADLVEKTVDEAEEAVDKAAQKAKGAVK